MLQYLKKKKRQKYRDISKSQKIKKRYHKYTNIAENQKHKNEGNFEFQVCKSPKKIHTQTYPHQLIDEQ